MIPTRKAAAAVAACLAAGAIITLLVPLVGACLLGHRGWTHWTSLDSGTGGTGGTGGWRRSRHPLLESTDIVRPATSGASIDDPRDLLRESKGKTYGEGWIPGSTRPDATSWSIVEAGWPARAFWGWWRIGPSGSGSGVEQRSLVRVPLLFDRPPAPPPNSVYFPLCPMLPGFAADTALFAAAAGLLWFGPGFARRWMRRRRGRCIACGYDRAGLTPGAVCPECGSATA